MALLKIRFNFPLPLYRAMSELEHISKVLDRVEKHLETTAFRPGWISSYAKLGYYIGEIDKQGRKAKAWVKAEKIYVKYINGTPHFAIKDVERALRNGRKIETAGAA